MNKYGIKINYLFNSGFAVETEKHFLIFDYFMDSVESGIKNKKNGAIGEEDLKIDKDIIVFSSHSHSDHFNPVILSWSEIRADITYVLSSDIEVSKKTEKMHFISAYEKIEIDNVDIKAYGSTDIGISFHVNVDGVNIFHSGDLNWWSWWDDEEGEIQKAEIWFKDEISKIKGEKIDIAFFPVDPRLEHNYCIGGEYFINELKPTIFIPMHFGTKYETTESFTHRMRSSSTKTLSIGKRGEEFIL